MTNIPGEGLFLQSSNSRIISVTITIIVSVVCLILALLHPGVKSAEVDLNDGGVWVTNTKLRMLAHLNYPARSMDSGLRSGSGSFTVFQDGEQVYLSDAESAKIGAVDVAQAELTSSVDFEGFTTTIGGDTLAVADPVSGKVWTQVAAHATPINPEEQEPQIDSMPGAVVAVGLDGSTHVFSPEEKSWLSLVPHGELVSKAENSFDGDAFDPQHAV